MTRLLSQLFATQWHALRLYRLSARLDEKGRTSIPSLLLLIGKFLSGIEIVHGASIGRGTIFVHGMGTVIGPGTVIGDNCRIFHNVTLGSRDGVTYPVIGDDVVLYPGAVLLGGITVGSGSVVGANAVVLTDVEPNTVVAGNPARVIGKRES